MKIKKILFLFCISLLGMFVLTSCNKKHTHDFESTYSYDKEGHWQKAICDHSDEKQNYGLHEFGDFTIVL